MKKLTLLILISAFSYSCSDSKVEIDYLIYNINIVDATEDTIIEDQLVGIKDHKIVVVDSDSNVKKYGSEQLIDGKRMYLMPGLWDNHVHFRGGEDLTEQNMKLLKLYLAFGITTVRDGGGDITPSVQLWNDQVKNNELFGPDIYTSGPKLDGDRPAWEGSLMVTDSISAARALDSLYSIEADYVKIYDGNLTNQAFYEIIRQTEKKGINVTGHMPMSADLMTAVKYGLDGTEHMYYVLKAAHQLSDKIQADYNGYGMVTPLTQNFDEEYADSVYRNLAESNFFVTPTLHIGKTLAELNIVDHSADTMLKYISPKIKDTYQRRIGSAQRGGTSYTETRQKWGQQFRSMVKPMYDAGIKILAGSDSGPYNSYVYPGVSLHKELEMMVESGLSPAEALVTSYGNGPAFINGEIKTGKIKSGYEADLLLLKKNPLVDISHTMSIHAVITNGRYISGSEIDSVKNSLFQN